WSFPLKDAIDGPSELPTPGILACADHSWTVFPLTLSLASWVNQSPLSPFAPCHAACMTLPIRARAGPAVVPEAWGLPGAPGLLGIVHCITLWGCQFENVGELNVVYMLWSSRDPRQSNRAPPPRSWQIAGDDPVPTPLMFACGCHWPRSNLEK